MSGPRIRVVVLDHNGGALTLECLRSLAATAWSAGQLELVLVDNASTTSITTQIADELPQVRIIRSERNLGFAGGNNLALRDLDQVDFVALVNNDVTVRPDWLAPLAETLASSPDLGAACPKILFQPSFRELQLEPGAGAVRVLGVRVGGTDVTHEVSSETRDGLRLRIPVGTHDSATEAAECEMQLATDAAQSVVATSGDWNATLTLNAGLDWYSIMLSGPLFDLVNNTGNELLAGGYAADRGFLQPDDGRFDVPEDVDAWCGGAVLLRREYLDDVGLLDDRLFLYYEDFELSWRGRRRGWKYRYDPRSVVRHVHGATSKAGSGRWQYYNARNRMLVLLRHATGREVAGALLAQLNPRRPDPRPGTAPRPTFLVARDGAVSGKIRLRALAGFVRRAPAMLVSRARDHRRPAR